MEKIKDTIKSYIAENILFNTNGYPYHDDASFLEEGIIDSINIMELVLFVEQNYAITVNDEEIVPENFDTVQKLAEFVVGKSEALSFSAEEKNNP